MLVFLLCKCILISLMRTNISPVDLLHRGRYRLIYAAIFGLMSNQFLNLVFGGTKICTSGNAYGVAFCNVGMCVLFYQLTNGTWQYTITANTYKYIRTYASYAIIILPTFTCVSILLLLWVYICNCVTGPYRPTNYMQGILRGSPGC